MEEGMGMLMQGDALSEEFGPSGGEVSALPLMPIARLRISLHREFPHSCPQGIRGMRRPMRLFTVARIILKFAVKPETSAQSAA